MFCIAGIYLFLIFTLRAKLTGAVYCNRSCPFVCLFVCVFVGAFVALWVCYHDNAKLHASIFTKWPSVGEGSDHLQLIKLWPSCDMGKGLSGGAKFFGSALILQPARSVCVSLSAFL